jgi:hypothetical protein
MDPTLDSLDTVTAGEGSVFSRWVSRAFLLLLTLVVLAGAVGLLGVHTSTATVDSGGYRLTLQYPGTARGGLDMTWRLTVTRPGGFAGPVTIAVTGSYFDIFETQAFYPTPSATSRDGQFVYLTFSPPPRGNRLVVSYDAYVQPYDTYGFRDARVSVLVHDIPAASLSYRTWLLP